MTVKRQLLLFIIFFALILTSLTTGISLLVNVKAIESIRIDRLASISHTASTALSEMIELKKDEVALLSSSWSVQDYLRVLDDVHASDDDLQLAKEGVNDRFHDYIDTLETFNDLVLLDPDGKVVVGYLDSTVNMDLSDNDYFINVVDQVDPFYVFTSQVHNPLTENDNPEIRHLAFSQAVRNPDGELQAVLVAFVETDFISDFTNNVIFAETGISSVIDADNFIICHPEHRFFLSYLTSQKLIDLLQLSKEGTIEPHGIITDDMDGIKRIYYYEVLPDIGMVMLLRQDYYEFSSERNDVLLYTLVAFFISTLLAIFIGYRIAVRFVTPLQKLTQAFSAGRKEGSYKQCDLSIKNEFGEMAANYNAMITNLEAHFKLLEAEKNKNEYASLHDEITGLLNRSAFEREISHLTMQNMPFGIFYLDIDNFNQINYSFGHHIGDALLKAVAERLSSSAVGFDLLARISGDEFLLSKAGSSEDMIRSALVVREEMRTPFILANSTFFVTVSVGISCYPKDATNSHDLISNADIAMARIKEDNKNHYCLYDAKMRHNMERHNRIIDLLKDCIDNGETFFMYQPIFDVETRTILGFESFVRIRNSQMGLLSPREFIPVAEKDYLLMHRLGLFSIRSACRFIARLRSECSFNGYVSINISAIQLQHPDFVSAFIGLMNEYELPHNSVQIEIKETLLLSGVTSALDKIKLLQDNGIMVALDNFDRQISSFKHLLAFPLDSIKFASSFLLVDKGDERLTNINHAIMGLISGFGLKMIASCVESAAEYQFLKENQYTVMQGFYLCKPLMEDNAVQALKEAGQMIPDESPKYS
ncbi:MAG: EAL domain-containing protein [Lachnospiraceae bacterium]|jgi:diguanylate cyclase (GGDEF)-like protein|nr:EAL domain-containing protein [Lachnospiraceae bacterium]